MGIGVERWGGEDVGIGVGGGRPLFFSKNRQNLLTACSFIVRLLLFLKLSKTSLEGYYFNTKTLEQYYMQTSQSLFFVVMNWKH